MEAGTRGWDSVCGPGAIRNEVGGNQILKSLVFMLMSLLLSVAGIVI